MEIRKIKKSEWEKLRAFNAAEYSPKHILTDKAYYDWQFDNFANEDRSFYTTMGLFGKNREILGTFGRFSSPFSFFGKKVDGNCLCNLMIKKDLRGLGFGSLLLSEASKLGDVVVDHAVNESAWPVFMKAGFEGEDMKRYVFKSPFEDARENELKFESVKKFDESIDKFWEKVQTRYPVSIYRSAEYLNWRYAQNPLSSYLCFVLKDGGSIKSLVVLKFEDAKNENGPTGTRVARIIDFVSEEGFELPAILRVLEFSKSQSSDFVDYFSSGDTHKESFLKAGFTDATGDVENYPPLLLNPESRKRKTYNFAVKKNPETRLRDWYTTKGGGDIDRPY